VWIFVNVLYIGLYAYKGLLQASAQQLVFIALSLMGFWAWRKEWVGRTAAPAAPEAA
jgi:nicotinamide mononucleotide transporter